MSSRASVLKAVRLTHLYLGVFIAPALLFFAITGGLQTFSLHETKRGSSYRPPAILAELGELHKEQTLVVPGTKPQTPILSTAKKQQDGALKTPPPAPSPAKPLEMPAAKTKNLLPMKLFFLTVSLGLLTSTLTGIYMSYKYVRNAKLTTALWIAGIAIPVTLTFL